MVGLEGLANRAKQSVSRISTITSNTARATDVQYARTVLVRMPPARNSVEPLPSTASSDQDIRLGCAGSRPLRDCDTALGALGAPGMPPAEMRMWVRRKPLDGEGGAPVVVQCATGAVLEWVVRG